MTNSTPATATATATLGTAMADDHDLGERIRHAFEGYPLPAPTTRPHLTPRSPVRRWLVPIGLAALALALVVPTVTAPPSAFATWTPEPVAQDPAIVGAVQPHCMGGPLPANATARDRAFAARIAALPLGVVDQRGRAAMLFYAEQASDGFAYNLCLGAVDEQGTYLGGGSAVGLGATEEPADGPVRLLASGRNTRHGPDIWTMLGGGDSHTGYAGTVESDVARVVVERSEGESVTASISGGFFAAWWPGTADATRIQAFDADGRLLTTLQDDHWVFSD